MSELPKTLAFVGAAALAVLLAWLAAPRPVQPEIFNDEGEIFFPAFTSPDQVASLEVREFDSGAAILRLFSVRQEGGQWTIPSHGNYPADAKDRMAKAAGLLIGLPKGAVRSDRPADHASFGLLDPDSFEDAGDLDALGTKVVFRDAAGGELASLIVGRKAGGEEGSFGGDGMRFVRVPGRNRVYLAKLPGEVNTRFSDWIETDLLKIDSWNIQKIVFDNYSIQSDGFRASIIPGDRLSLGKKDGQWVLDGLEEGEETNTTKVSDIARELDGIRIVGVRRKPEGLNDRLEVADGFELERLMASLQGRGFYYDPRRNTIFSNQGDLIAVNDKGVRYTLRFGEVVYGSADDVSSEREDESQPGGEGGSGEGQKANRYLMVTVALDESVFKKPAEAALDKGLLGKRQQARDDINAIIAAIGSYKSRNDGALPDALERLTEGDEPLLKELKKDPWGQDYIFERREGDTYVIRSPGDGEHGPVSSDDFAKEDAFNTTSRDWEAYERKLKEGKEAVESLSRRFAPWYYVIDAESFRKLRAARSDLAQKKEPGEKEEGDGGGDPHEDPEEEEAAEPEIPPLDRADSAQGR